MSRRGLKWAMLLVLAGFHMVVSAQITQRAQSSPSKVLEQRAQALSRLGRTEEALDLYLEILYQNPKNNNLYFRVAGLMPALENAPTLLQIVDDILKLQPDNTRLRGEKGRLLYLLNRKDEALRLWEAVILENRGDRYHYTTIANAMLQAGAGNEAIDLLQRGRTHIKDPAAFAFELARIHAAKHNYKLATREYLSHLNGNPAMLDHISNQIINMLDNDGAFADIQIEFKSVVNSDQVHQNIRLAWAKILLHEKQYTECVHTVLNSDVKRETRQVIGIADDLAAEQAWREAGELYLYVSSHSTEQRDIGEALLKLASSYEHRLDTKTNMHSLSGYFSGNRFLEPDLKILSEDDPSLERTLKLYDSLQTLLPKSREALRASYNIAELHLTVSGDVDRALQGFEDIFDHARERADRVDAGLRMVDAWLVRGDTSRAIETLEKVSARTGMDSDHPMIVASRIKILLNRGDIPSLKKELLNLMGAASPNDPIFNDGMELMALIDGNGGDTDPRLVSYLLAEKMIFQHKLTEAIQLLTDIQGGPETIADEALTRAIQLSQFLGQDTQALTLMDRFFESYPESPWRPNVLIWKAEDLQFRQGDAVAAIPYYESVIVEHGGYLQVQQVRARLRDILGTGS